MPALAPRLPSPAELASIRKDARLTQEEVAARMKVGSGKHYLQEDHPDVIGEEVAARVQEHGGA